MVQRDDDDLRPLPTPAYTIMGRSLFTMALAATINDLDRLPPDSVHTASWFLDRLPDK